MLLCRRENSICLAIAALAGLYLAGSPNAGLSAQDRADNRRIRLIVRADDIGSSHAANVACIRTYQEGIARSAEVMVPAPWFNEAVKMLNENPGLDVGVHLTLTSEWDNCKWGPITRSPSLMDQQGHFYPMTSQRSDFPPNTGFLQANPKVEEVEKELRAQIELAKAKIKNVSHLSCHMGTPVCTPQLQALVERLSAEYALPVNTPGVRPAPNWGDSDMTAEQREQAMVKMLEQLGPGTWLLVEHPGIDCPEMQALGHKGYWNVAAHRDAVTRAFTSPKVKETIEKRGIELVSYRDLYERLRKEN